DLLDRDLHVLLGAEAPLLDRHLVLGVQLAEVQIEVAHRADQLHRHVDEAEAQRAAPQRACHQTLAFSAASRSSPCSGSSCSARSISSPLALRLIRSSTASRYSSP